jgi:RNA polymerase sigma-70 factor (ECF subfamily)
MDRSQFERLAIEHLDAVYRVALHLTRDIDQAEDLVQEVYVRALRSEAAASFESRGGGMRAWLFKIAHNAFYTRLKRDARAPTPVGAFHAEASEQPPPDEPPPAWDRASLDWDSVDARLKAAIEGLVPEHREVLMMWGVDGLKYREIATILGVPIGTVMSRLHRARMLVGRALAEHRADLIPRHAGEKEPT